jgi:hypothetical protein
MVASERITMKRSLRKRMLHGRAVAHTTDFLANCARHELWAMAYHFGISHPLKRNPAGLIVRLVINHGGAVYKRFQCRAA